MSAASTRIERSALVPYRSVQMFDLVADIESYPQFLPWCQRALVHGRSGDVVEASLTMAKGPISKSLTTRNTMEAPSRIEMQLVRGPFSHLRGRWNFDEVDGAGSRVSLQMEFAIDSTLLRRTLGPLFGEIANSMVDAFCRRAADVYGPV